MVHKLLDLGFWPISCALTASLLLSWYHRPTPKVNKVSNPWAEGVWPRQIENLAKFSAPVTECRGTKD